MNNFIFKMDDFVLNEWNPGQHSSSHINVFTKWNDELKHWGLLPINFKGIYKMGALPPQPFSHVCVTSLPLPSCCGCLRDALPQSQGEFPCIAAVTRKPWVPCTLFWVLLAAAGAGHQREQWRGGQWTSLSRLFLHPISCDLSKSFASCVNEEVKNNIVRV